MAATTLVRLARVCTQLRRLDPDMNVSQLSILLAVATTPGASQKDIYEALDISSSSMSRSVKKLEEGKLGLLSSAPAADGRFVALKLSRQGTFAVNAIIDAMEA